MPQALFSTKSAVSEDSIYEIYALCYGGIPERRVHENFMQRDLHDGPMPLDFSVWIVRNQHRTVLVDTGFSARAAAERRRPIDFNPIDVLPKLGIDPDKLEDIFLTHLHFDHAGNIDRFAKARFHIQDAEVSFATGRCMCDSHVRAVFDVEDVVTLVRHTYAERVVFHDGEATPLPGITVHPAPGHSNGLQAVKVMTKRGPVLLASDACHLYANLARRAPYAVTVDVAATLRTYTRMLEIAGSIDRIIPGHDPRVRMLYPLVRAGDMELAALHETPKPHSVADLRQLDFKA